MEGRRHTHRVVIATVTEPWPLPGTLPSGELQAFVLVPTAIPNRKARSREVEEPPPMPSVRTWVSLFPLLLNILILHGGAVALAA